MIRTRCAIYTRKSSEEGLDQAFNSLDAQRESCAAYILSQASEGWVGLPAIYDDGGLSGGTLERPALKRLLADVAAGEIDIIVVYKVDRLTRSLFDFAKLVETFDKAGTSFVSVTQSFNTTTSMGRLTLNMLLSFAQFEREVTAERIRDKISASKAKGMWMGGTPPLGYRPDERSLAIVDEHADLIRHMYRRYLDLGSVRELVNELHAGGQHVPHRSRTNGGKFGGGLWARGQVYSILRNPVYVGEIHHRDQVYQGKHPPIIDRDLFDQVQGSLADISRGRERRRRMADTSLLAGKVVDEAGRPLIAVHATKTGVRYRYYVSRGLHHCQPDVLGGNGTRVPARELEKLVASGVSEALTDPLILLPEMAALSPKGLAAAIETAEHLSLRIRAMEPDLMNALIECVTVTPAELHISLAAPALASTLGIPTIDREIVLQSGASLKRCGRAIRLVRSDGNTGAAGEIDVRLVRLIAKAREWWGAIERGELTIADLARRENVMTSWVSRVTRLAFLAPDIVDAITTGRAPPSLSMKALLAPAGIAISWQKQREMLMGSA